MMFGSSYWYVDGAAGARFNWSKTPLFRCPTQTAAHEALREGGEWPEGEQAAKLLGVDLRFLIQRVGGGSHYRQRDAAERLTDRCACGARMERVGFRAWEDQPASEETSGSRVAERLGIDGPRPTVREAYLDTKREAEAWARENAAISKKVAA